jgi:hypothetical protein
LPSVGLFEAFICRGDTRVSMRDISARRYSTPVRRDRGHCHLLAASHASRACPEQPRKQ